MSAADANTVKRMRRTLQAVILALMLGGFWEPLALYAGLALLGVYVFSRYK